MYYYCYNFFGVVEVTVLQRSLFSTFRPARQVFSAYSVAVRTTNESLTLKFQFFIE